jgi:bifunctional aspartokinase / homoserine dehydrogenase 1
VKKPLRVMKFGGTSVGDADCIARAARIAAAAAQEGEIVVVVSAMSGVTNRLIVAANRAQTGDREEGSDLSDALRKQHETAVDALIGRNGRREPLLASLLQVLEEGRRFCEGTALLRELTPRTLDSISSLGERLSAPIFAAALNEIGVASETVSAMELIVTDASHGGADPLRGLTRRRTHSRLRPLLERGIVPVVTGFIGATEDGILTTLGRGGSDYSATILGEALNADEIIIWTDVDGVMTADPRLVPDAHTIPEISYREATELAYFGAKVLHPKTLHAVAEAGIPVWIRNSFAPEKLGTKITPRGQGGGGGGVKALTAMSDVALISIGGPAIASVPDMIARTFATTAAARTNVLLISQASSQNEICFMAPLADAKRTVDALRHEFAQDLAHEKMEHVTLDSDVAIVAVVGENMRGIPGIAGRTFSALGRDGVNVIAIAQGSSESNISFVVARSAIKAALEATHREFTLGVPVPAI